MPTSPCYRSSMVCISKVHIILGRFPVSAPVKTMVFPYLDYLRGYGIRICSRAVASGRHSNHRIGIPVQIHHAAVAVMGTAGSRSHITPIVRGGITLTNRETDCLQFIENRRNFMYKLLMYRQRYRTLIAVFINNRDCNRGQISLHLSRNNRKSIRKEPF